MHMDLKLTSFVLSTFVEQRGVDVCMEMRDKRTGAQYIAGFEEDEFFRIFVFQGYFHI